MIEIQDNFGLYSVLTSPKRGYDYVTKLLVDHEVAFVQLRIKEGDPFTILKIAETMRKITENSKTRFIVNDYLDIAIDSSADGIHVGQDDLSVEEVRQRMGEQAIIGLSTHNPMQVEEAQKLPLNYIGTGPVYLTPTKVIPDPVLGIETMQEMLGLSHVPAVCIGGISLERLRDVLDNGGRNFCMVRPLCETDTPAPVLKKILALWNEYQ